MNQLKREGDNLLSLFKHKKILPVVNGRDIIFAYRNNLRPVREVRLVHHVSLLDRAPVFQRVDGTGYFVFHLVLPPKSRLEYTFGLKYSDGDKEIITDPYNPEIAWCPFGPKSVTHTSPYIKPEWSIHRADNTGGKIKEHSIRSQVFNSKRIFKIYEPAASPPRDGYPILLVHDGFDYINFSGIIDVLDNLIADGIMQPIIAVLTKPENRNYEYSCTHEHPIYLAEELLSWIRQRYPVSDSREFTGLLGSSFGAVSSIYTASQYPHVFGKLFLQSGSFRYQDAVRSLPLFEAIDEFDRITLFLETEFFPNGPAEKMKFFHSCGAFESILHYNRRFADDIRATGHTIKYCESNDGHNWISWRNHLREGFQYLFPAGNLEETSYKSDLILTEKSNE